MTQVSLYLFSITNLKLHISVTPIIVKNVILNLDFLKVSGPNYIQVVVQKNFLYTS